MAQNVSELLFDSKAGPDTLHKLDVPTLSMVAGEIPSPTMPKNMLDAPCDILEFLSTHTGILPSRTEAKKAIQNNALSINKLKITDVNAKVTSGQLLHGQFMMVENGKKNKYLVQFS
jgi:tyrosyl-tRNA synthetase